MTKTEYLAALDVASRDGTFPSFNPDTGDCAYRADFTPNCRQRCAVGILIPDDRYHLVTEGMSIDVINDLATDVPSGLSISDLLSVQRVHDLHTNRSVHDVPAHRVPWDADAFMDQICKLEFFKT